MNLYSDQRGAAMVEGVIVLPFFVVAFAAILHFHGAFSAQLAMASKARQCAWEYSLSGCQTPIKGCRVASIDDEVVDLVDVDGTAKKTLQQAQAPHGNDNLTSKFTGLWAGREGIVAHPGKEVKKLSILGGGHSLVSARYAVLCNERSYALDELVQKAYCSMDGPGCK